MKLFNNIKVFTHNTIKKGEVVLDEKGPKWAIIGGAALLVASTVVACKQTTKAEAIVTEFHKQQGYIEEAATSDVYKGQYTEEDKKKDTIQNCIKTGVAFVKLYRAPIIMTAVGLTGILWGTNKLDNKVKNLTLSVAAITEALQQYRHRVAKAVGTEAEQDLYLGVENQPEVIDSKTGEVVSKAKKLVKENDIKRNPLIFEFGPINWDGSVNYTFDSSAPSLNLVTVRQIQRNAQRDLELFGQYWVRDIFKSLGMKCPSLYTTAGWVVERDENGNLYSPIGDAKIDLGLIDNLSFYADADDLAEEEAGIAEARPIMLNPNCTDIRAYLYNKEKKKFNIK